mmetsp:Transcript_46661/g.109752  ORF Transcript_46661/g.109752 Transcript_46661/m.109752 type:complete len:225 (+) Transcript_46661:232-906(+)
MHPQHTECRLDDTGTLDACGRTNTEGRPQRGGEGRGERGQRGGWTGKEDEESRLVIEVLPERRDKHVHVAADVTDDKEVGGDGGDAHVAGNELQHRRQRDSDPHFANDVGGDEAEEGPGGWVVVGRWQPECAGSERSGHNLRYNKDSDAGGTRSTLDHSVRNETSPNRSERASNQWNPRHPLSDLIFGQSSVLLEERLGVQRPDVPSSVPHSTSQAEKHQAFVR